MIGITLPFWLWWIIVGLIAGWITGKITNGSGYGLFGDMVLGILGAIIGSWLFHVLGIGIYSRVLGRFLSRILTAVCGAVILVLVSRMVRK